MGVGASCLRGFLQKTQEDDSYKIGGDLKNQRQKKNSSKGWAFFYNCH